MLYSTQASNHSDIISTKSMSDFTDRILVSSQTSVGTIRPKAEFAHYGFLVVDAWCAYGVQFGNLSKCRTDLVADSGPVLESFKELEQVDSPQITFEETRKPGEKGFPKAGQRPENMARELLME
jgi:hypothetical protein